MEAGHQRHTPNPAQLRTMGRLAADGRIDLDGSFCREGLADGDTFVFEERGDVLVRISPSGSVDRVRRQRIGPGRAYFG